MPPSKHTPKYTLYHCIAIASHLHSHSQTGRGSVCKRMIVCICKCVRVHMTCMVGMGKCARAWERLIVLGMCVFVCVCGVDGMQAMHTQISSFLAFSCGVRARVFQLWIEKQTCPVCMYHPQLLARSLKPCPIYILAAVARVNKKKILFIIYLALSLYRFIINKRWI